MAGELTRRMKQFFFAFLLLTVSSSIPVFLALAEETPPPEVDEPLSPVDADKALLTGTAEPGARIVVTGGVYEVPPVTADEDGHFEITVALVQESSNSFFIRATNPGAEGSEQVEVTIIEGVEVTQEYEASTGEDHTAPAAPDIEETAAETDEGTYTIQGNGEKDTAVLVDGEESGEIVGNNGTFSVEVALSGGGEEDTFTISLKDDAGNVSSGVKVKITGNGEAGEVIADEESTDEGKTPLTDIEGHWAKDYINQLYNDDVVSGYGDGRFGPDDSVTRAQILKIALLAFELPVEGGENDFTDIPSGEWYEDYVSSASGDLDIVSGYTDNTFRPNNPVTRAEALKIILKAAGVELGTGTGNFSDVDTVNDWFAVYTAYAKEIGLIGGYTDGTFRGNQPITRAEVCKIVVELMEFLE